VIFNLNRRGNIQRVVMGERIGSLVNEDKRDSRQLSAFSLQLSKL